MSAQAPSQTTFVVPAQANPLAFVRLNKDNSVAVICKHLEMGQGIHTGLATLVAEEIDAAVSQIRVEYAPASVGPDATYGNALMGGIQGTGGQTATQVSYMAMRLAGAAMRQMILGAAAKRFGVNVDPADLSIRQGVVQHSASGQKASFGELAADAMAMPVPKDVSVKASKDFTYLGKHFPRVDANDKIHGKTKFTQDIKLPGMLVAVIARPTRPGSKVVNFDAGAAVKFPDVTNVVQTPAGVAVIADNFWSAYEARDLLNIDWDDSSAWRMSSSDIWTEFDGLMGEAGLPAVKIGDADAALANASKRLSADYQVGYTTHATFETMNAVMQIKDGKIEMWGPSQIFSIDGGFLSHATGIPPQNIKLNMLNAGGSFGRRAGPAAGCWAELLGVITALKTDRPVKLICSREDDMSSRSAYYRPGFKHRIEAGLDAAGALVGWKHRVVGQSIAAATPMEGAMVKDGIDWFSVEGSADMPYAIPNVHLDLHSPELPINISWMRASGTFHNGFANESMMDELALAAGADPLQFRLNLLAKGNRERGCLELAAEKAGWSKPLSPSAPGTKRGRGLAVLPSHRSYGAAVIEVTVAADQSYTVDRIVCALDCGQVINPDNVKAQMEGGAGFGLAMARFSEITFKDGEVEQKFYSDHHITRMHTMPAVECHIVPSTEGPSGCSETICAPIAAALANALANATGIRVRTVPLRLPNEPTEEHWDVPAKLNTFKGAPRTTLI